MSNAGKVAIITLTIMGSGFVVALVTLPIFGPKNAVDVATPFVFGALLFFLAALIYEGWLNRKGRKRR